ncbi:MAG: ribonuclease R [Lachnospiraceae bacterium]|nr:ribonuclease R [Lachnospiraceae bacterium]
MRKRDYYPRGKVHRESPEAKVLRISGDERYEHRIGRFIMNARGFGFVTVEGEADDYFIPRTMTNHAFQGDLVEIVLLESAGNRSRRRSGGSSTEAAVIRIVERGIREIVGTFEQREGCAFGFVIPDRVKLPLDVFIPAEASLQASDGHKVIARITDYGDEGRSPEGEIVQILGHIGDPGVEITSMVRAFELPEDFPEEVLREAEAVAQMVPGAEASDAAAQGKGARIFDRAVSRLDLRDTLMITIDGEDSKDLDDAVSLTYDGEDFHLGVHIADVSEYVREGSALDAEGYERGTSVYLADRVLPMLPTALCNGICSLNEAQDRLALSCLMTISGTGEIKEHEITESLIRTRKRMTYTQVQALLDDPDLADTPGYEGCGEVLPMLQEMAGLAQILRNRRRRRGSIDFDLPECKVTLDADGKVTDVRPYEHTIANDLIEEFMLAANETIAEHFYWLDLPFVYRVHEVPDAEKIAALVQTIAAFGYGLKALGRKNSKVNPEEVHPKEIQKLLAGIQGKPEEALITRLALRSMRQAKYAPYCSGHFGLACDYYCHFTSPIRRYPDLQIHRIIKDYLRGELTAARVDHYRSILDSVAEQSSKRERRAQEAEREVDKFEKVCYMEQFLGEEYDGIISGVTKWGVYVELPNTVEGMIAVGDLPGGTYYFDEDHMQLIGRRGGSVYRLGERIRVIVSSSNLINRTIDFLLADRQPEEE